MTIRQLTFAAAVAGLVLPLPSLQREVIDRATFEFYRDGVLVGREEYVVERVHTRGRPQSIAISFRATFPADRPETTVTGVVQFQADSQLATAQIDVSGDEEQRTLVSVGPRKLTLRMITPTGASTREYPVRNVVRIVDARVIAPLAILPPTNRATVLDLVGSGGEAQADVPARVAAANGGREVAIGSGSLRRQLRYNDLGRLVEVRVPGQEIIARRVSSNQ